jgi:hypothetical protein
MEAIIQHGTVADTAFLDEPDLLLQSLTITPQRTEGRYRGPNKATQLVTQSDPVVDLQFSGIIKDFAGFVIRGPGAAVWAVANYAAEQNGFDPADGMLIYRDPGRELSSDETPDSINFTITHLPFVAKPFPAPFMRVTGPLTSNGTTPMPVPLMPYVGMSDGKPSYGVVDGGRTFSVDWIEGDGLWFFAYDIDDGSSGAWETDSAVASPDLANNWVPAETSPGTGTPVFTAVYEA